MRERIFPSDPGAMIQRLQRGLVKKIMFFDQVSSTNAEAKYLAQNGAMEGTVVLAKTQLHGRGRYDRRWESPKGGLYLSVILRPRIPLSATTVLPLLVSLAVAKTIQTLGIQPTIKWPNDVRIKKKKVSGILLESEAGPTYPSYVVLGVGVNLNVDVTTLPEDLSLSATSLSKELKKPVDYEQFFGVFFLFFEEYYARFLHGESEMLLREWSLWSDTLGKQVEIRTTKETIRGKAISIDSSGFLQLQTDAGEMKTITSGDCLYVEEL